MPLGRAAAAWYLFSVRKYDLRRLQAQSGLHQHSHILGLPPARPLLHPVGRKGGVIVVPSSRVTWHAGRGTVVAGVWITEYL